MRYEDIENAFLFVSIGPQFSKTAYLCRDTDQIYYVTDLDDLDELPDHVDGVERYIQIPDRNDLDLVNLVTWSVCSNGATHTLDSSSC